MELDNHSGIHFFEANFRPIMYTTQQWTVASLIPEYSEQTDVYMVVWVEDSDSKN